MNLRLASRLRRNTGQSVVELALLLPVLLLLMFLVYDLGRAIWVRNVLINMSREGANLAARSTRTSASFQQIMDSLASTSGLSAITTDGNMYVTEIAVNSGNRSITQTRWHKSTSAAASEVTAGAAVTMPVAENTSAYIFEVIYTYHSILLSSYTPLLRSATVF